MSSRGFLKRHSWSDFWIGDHAIVIERHFCCQRIIDMNYS
jgi:hypothetical protein